MTEIFISYSSKDSKKTGSVVKLLEKSGWDVWWDKKIPPGKEFDEVISEALGAAKCIVVLWSKNSVTSGWVLDEAFEGRERDILVPAQIDSVKLPFRYRRLQTIDLSRWKGATSSEDTEKLINAVKALVEPATKRQPRKKPAARAAARKTQRKPTGALDGKAIVFTGTLSESRRAHSEKIRAVAPGASFANSVSGKTDYLVVGEDPGPTKLKAAEKHGVKQLTEQQWLKMLNEAYTRILVGKTIVFTGKLSQPRARLEAVARKLGAKPVGAISGKTNYLVVGEDAGRKKLSEAQKYGVQIFKEDVWNDIVATL